jgi:hypothetical protein
LGKYFSSLPLSSVRQRERYSLQIEGASPTKRRTSRNQHDTPLLRTVYDCSERKIAQAAGCRHWLKQTLLPYFVINFSCLHESSPVYLRGYQHERFARKTSLSVRKRCIEETAESTFVSSVDGSNCRDVSVHVAGECRVPHIPQGNSSRRTP